MIPLPDAQDDVLARVEPLPPAAIPVGEAHGLVLGQTVRSAIAIPPFANSAMDGYAVRATDTAGATPDRPARLRVVADIPAGSTGEPEVGGGEAARIMTGAPMPRGADAIVMVERTRVDGDHVLVEAPAELGDHVRPEGDDLDEGAVVAEAGEELTPARLAGVVSAGAGEVRAHPRPRVGVLSTGDELVPAGQSLGPGQIYDSNRPMLLGIVTREGFTPVDLGHVADEADRLVELFASAAGRVDAVVTSGGVSVGEHDVVRQVLEAKGDVQWMQIAIKPAKPFAFGWMDGVPIFGLPGNPVSAAVSFELLARPALRRMAGHPPGALHRFRRRAVAGTALERRPDGKTHFVRVVGEEGPDGRLVVRSAGAQGSHQLSALAAANALAVVPDGDGLAPGEELEVIPVGLAR